MSNERIISEAGHHKYRQFQSNRAYGETHYISDVSILFYTALDLVFTSGNGTHEQGIAPIELGHWVRQLLHPAMITQTPVEHFSIKRYNQLKIVFIRRARFKLIKLLINSRSVYLRHSYFAKA